MLLGWVPCFTLPSFAELTGLGVYGGSKAAIDLISEALRAHTFSERANGEDLKHASTPEEFARSALWRIHQAERVGKSIVES